MALAIDMFGEGKIAEHPKQAGEFVKQAPQNFANFRQIFVSALQELKSNPQVDANGAKFDIDLAYDEDADKESWQDMKEFFVKIL